jgi:hypothetical protein
MHSKPKTVTTSKPTLSYDFQSENGRTTDDNCGRRLSKPRDAHRARYTQSICLVLLPKGYKEQTIPGYTN